MNNLFIKIIFLFLFGFIFRFLINSGYINIFCYLPAVIYLIIYDNQSINFNINYKIGANLDNNSNSNSNILRKSVINSENKTSIFSSLKKINLKFSNKYNDILHKISLQKKTFLWFIGKRK
jgi:hypothetical protein